MLLDERLGIQQQQLGAEEALAGLTPVSKPTAKSPSAANLAERFGFRSPGGNEGSGSGRRPTSATAAAAEAFEAGLQDQPPAPARSATPPRLPYPQQLPASPLAGSGNGVAAHESLLQAAASVAPVSPSGSLKGVPARERAMHSSVENFLQHLQRVSPASQGLRRRSLNPAATASRDQQPQSADSSPAPTPIPAAEEQGATDSVARVSIGTGSNGKRAPSSVSASASLPPRTRSSAGGDGSRVVFSSVDELPHVRGPAVRVIFPSGALPCHVGPQGSTPMADTWPPSRPGCR